MDLLLWVIPYAFIGAFTLFLTGVWSRKPSYELVDLAVAVAVGWAVVWVATRLARGVRRERRGPVGE